MKKCTILALLCLLAPTTEAARRPQIPDEPMPGEIPLDQIPEYVGFRATFQTPNNQLLFEWLQCVTGSNKKEACWLGQATVDCGGKYGDIRADHFDNDDLTVSGNLLKREMTVVIGSIASDPAQRTILRFDYFPDHNGRGTSMLTDATLERRSGKNTDFKASALRGGSTATIRIPCPVLINGPLEDKDLPRWPTKSPGR